MAHTQEQPQSDAKDVTVVVVKESQAVPVEKPKPISYWTLYRYATRAEVAAIIFGTGMASLAGALYPCVTLVFGDLIGRLPFVLATHVTNMTIFGYLYYTLSRAWLLDDAWLERCLELPHKTPTPLRWIRAGSD